MPTICSPETTSTASAFRTRAAASASPVAADGRIYLSSEDGDIFVVRAGPSFELLGRYPMGEPLMATPALAGDTMYVRGERHLFAIAKT